MTSEISRECSGPVFAGCIKDRELLLGVEGLLLVFEAEVLPRRFMPRALGLLATKGTLSAELSRPLGKTGGKEAAAVAAFVALSDGSTSVLAGGFGDLLICLGFVGGVIVVPVPSCADMEFDPLVSSPIDLVVVLSSPPTLLEASVLLFGL